MRKLLVLMLRAYQLIVSPHMPPACRFFPTCSHFAVQAVECHGAARGGWLAFRRVLRCHPLATPGYDPVP